jgi:hypothetical protein
MSAEHRTSDRWCAGFGGAEQKDTGKETEFALALQAGVGGEGVGGGEQRRRVGLQVEPAIITDPAQGHGHAGGGAELGDAQDAEDEFGGASGAILASVFVAQGANLVGALAAVRLLLGDG